MLGKIQGRRRGDERIRWHHQLNGHEFKQTPGDGEGQGSLARCSLWGHKESDTTERLNKQQPAQILTTFKRGQINHKGQKHNFLGTVRDDQQNVNTEISK